MQRRSASYAYRALSRPDRPEGRGAPRLLTAHGRDGFSEDTLRLNVISAVRRAYDLYQRKVTNYRIIILNAPFRSLTWQLEMGSAFYNEKCLHDVIVDLSTHLQKVFAF